MLIDSDIICREYDIDNVNFCCCACCVSVYLDVYRTSILNRRNDSTSTIYGRSIYCKMYNKGIVVFLSVSK